MGSEMCIRDRSTAVATTGVYDGTAWASAPSLGAALNNNGGASNTADNTTGLVFGGGSPPYAATYEFTAGSTSLNIETFTTS